MSKKKVFMPTLFILILIGIIFSCVRYSDCRLLSDINTLSTWKSYSSEIVFGKWSGGVLKEDTLYTFGSSRTHGDSIYLYKLGPADRWEAINTDSLNTWDLERQLLGTDYDFNCDRINLIRKGNKVQYQINE